VISAHKAQRPARARFPDSLRRPLALALALGLYAYAGTTQEMEAVATEPAWEIDAQSPALGQPALPEVVPAQEPPPALRIVAVGDIMLDASARPIMDERGYDYAFAQMRPMFDGAHLTFGNLEGPLTERGTAEPDKTYLFRSPPQALSRALADAGFKVVSLANNHSLDYGAEGLEDTMAALEAAGIAYAGAGRDLAQARRPAILEVAGRRVAFLAYSLTLPETFYAQDDKAGTAFGKEEQVREDVTRARSEADIVLVSFHWGQEGTTSLREYQVELGHAAIESGAAAVIGHHPHVVQSVERYRDGVILYSLGNFAFGSYSPSAQVGAAAELIFEGNALRTVRLHPLNVNNFEVDFAPRLLEGEAAQRAAEALYELSLARDTWLDRDNGTATLELAPPLQAAEVPALDAAAIADGLESPAAQ
jgi:poly-gamma-glutamate synthesis protein (capsule biosynthesis protein)